LVLPLALTVRVCVDGVCEAVVDTEVGGNSVPNSTTKLFATSRGNINQYTQFADHMFEKASCFLWRVNVISAGEIGPHCS
jgi:hypothetical protein